MLEILLKSKNDVKNIKTLYIIVAKKYKNINYQTMNHLIMVLIASCWEEAKKSDFFWGSFNNIDAPTTKEFFSKAFKYLTN